MENLKNLKNLKNEVKNLKKEIKEKKLGNLQDYFTRNQIEILKKMPILEQKLLALDFLINSDEIEKSESYDEILESFEILNVVEHKTRTGDGVDYCIAFGGPTVYIISLQELFIFKVGWGFENFEIKIEKNLIEYKNIMDLLDNVYDCEFYG